MTIVIIVEIMMEIIEIMIEIMAAVRIPASNFKIIINCSTRH